MFKSKQTTIIGRQVLLSYMPESDKWNLFDYKPARFQCQYHPFDIILRLHVGHLKHCCICEYVLRTDWWIQIFCLCLHSFKTLNFYEQLVELIQQSSFSFQYLRPHDSCVQTSWGNSTQHPNKIYFIVSSVCLLGVIWYYVLWRMNF